ncbi:hypothetical protein EON65_37015 [archaeon]|nr:MAG: hypothetical protein EON65_37015 [archaeon]
MGSTVSVVQKCLYSALAPSDLLNSRFAHFVHIVGNNRAARDLFSVYLKSNSWILDTLKKNRHCYRLPPRTDESVVNSTPKAFVAPSAHTDDGNVASIMATSALTLTLSPLVLFTIFTHFVHSDLFCGWMLYSYYGDAVSILDQIKWTPDQVDSDPSTCVSSLNDYTMYKQTMRNSLLDFATFLTSSVSEKTHFGHELLCSVSECVENCKVGVMVLKGHHNQAPCVYLNASMAVYVRCEKLAARGKDLMTLLQLEEKDMVIPSRRGCYLTARPIDLTLSASTAPSSLLLVPVGGGEKKHSSQPYTVALVYEECEEGVREYVEMLLLLLPQVFA